MPSLIRTLKNERKARRGSWTQLEKLTNRQKLKNTQQVHMMKANAIIQGRKFKEPKTDDKRDRASPDGIRS